MKPDVKLYFIIRSLLSGSRPIYEILMLKENIYIGKTSDAETLKVLNLI